MLCSPLASTTLLFPTAPDRIGCGFRLDVISGAGCRIPFDVSFEEAPDLCRSAVPPEAFRDEGSKDIKKPNSVQG